MNTPSKEIFHSVSLPKHLGSLSKRFERNIWLLQEYNITEEQLKLKLFKKLHCQKSIKLTKLEISFLNTCW